MKHTLLISILFLTINVRAQNVFIADTGHVTFYSYAPIEDIDATSKQVNSIYNNTNNEIAFMIPMRSFTFKKALMQEHFNEKYIESDKYPQATFKGKVNEKVDVTKPGKYAVSATGTLTIHGKEKQITEKGEMEIGDNRITLTTKFFVAIADYNIKIPQLLFNNVADTIEVRMQTVYIPYKKK
jgi:polyisoprenoid-binding protein YceI